MNQEDNTRITNHFIITKSNYYNNSAIAKELQLL